MTRIKYSCLALSLVLLLFISPIVTIRGEEQVFDIEEEKKYTWTILISSSEFMASGSKFRITIETIYNGSWDMAPPPHLGTILNYSLEVYNTFFTPPQWEPHEEPIVMTIFNQTTHYFFINLDTDEYIAPWGLLFIIPSPLNLTRIGEYLNTTSDAHFNNYTVSGNKLTMQDLNLNRTFIFSFSDNGLLSEYRIISNSNEETILHLKYGDISESEITISHGFYFLFIIPFTVIILMLFGKRKIIKKS